MPDKGGVQLLPETRKKIEVKVPGENRLFAFGFVMLLIIAGGYFALDTYVQTLIDKMSSLDTELLALEEKRDKKMEVQLSDLAKQTQLVVSTLSGHTFFTQAFAKLENLLHPQVHLKAVSLSALSNEIKILIEAQGYTAIARQISAFLADDGVEDLKIGSIRASDTGFIEIPISVNVKKTNYFLKAQAQQ